MEAVISKSSVRGTAHAPPSKSYTHRAILSAGYSDGATVTNPLESADPRATARAVRAFGGDAEWRTDSIAVWGFGGRPEAPDDPVDCENSGTTMRLATATAALADGTTRLTGDESLRSRPQGPLLDAIEQLGASAESEDGDGTAPLTVTGPIEGGRVSIPGDVSSQFVTALLMAGAVTEEGISVSLETDLKSAPYVDVTLEVLEAFGVDARETPFGYTVDGGQTYSPPPGGYAVPGDFSSMSYLLAAGALAGDPQVSVEDAVPSAQGDAAIVEILDRMGADVQWNRDRGFVTVSESPLEGVAVSVADTPDLLPTVAAVGAAADGETVITDCEHVRYKETDRVAAMAHELTEMGAEVTEREDELVVHGDESDLQGGRLDGRGDHRIVMALAVAGFVAEGRTVIRGAEHVDVSFPGFFDTLEALGANVVQR
ncbi:3-phosphoshikimate 1-carboxyvinyltransferase [Halobacteriales archaeon QS_1_68_20]|nr:MAG: 3-phosphoshikimate 1-carboxyvinyltransferase [Halobacteriales archaeon QS_1_68_20]